MTRSLIYVTLLSAAAAWGQVPSPAFEVASIRPSPPNSPTARTPPYANVDKAGVRLRLPLQGVVCMAYNVRADQIVAPAWLNTTRFDIEAKLPDGATDQQIPSMLQNLLADRFKMTVHRESREQPVYALVVGKDGLKMKPKAAAAPNSGPDAADAPPPRTNDGCNPRANQSTTADGKGSVVTNGDMKMSMRIDGLKVEVSIETSRTTTLAEWLTTELTLVKGILGNGPSIVIDKTNLTGEYEIRLAQSAEGDSGAIVPGQSMAPLGDPWFFGAIEKLGLKLERQKAPIETIVIDRIEKTPTEN